MIVAESSTKHEELKKHPLIELIGSCQEVVVDPDSSVTACAESSTRKNLTNSLEQKIKCLEKQRKECLFHIEKVSAALCERPPQVAELKTKLDASERFLSTREKEQQQRQREDDRQRDLTRDLLQREKEKERLNEELHELKKENKLLKENNALANKEKEHYKCEIKRLNKALQNALNIKCSFSKDCLRKSQVEFCHEEMITEMEVLKQQRRARVQIYEEDFKKERSDRERLNQEKEELQKINETSQSQLNRLNSQSVTMIKACQMEKEKLEKRLRQIYFSTCNCGLVFHLQDSWVPTGPGAVQKQQEHPSLFMERRKEFTYYSSSNIPCQLKKPDYQWYALDQLPPDVQHKANESVSMVSGGHSELPQMMYFTAQVIIRVSKNSEITFVTNDACEFVSPQKRKSVEAHSNREGQQARGEPWLRTLFFVCIVACFCPKGTSSIALFVPSHVSLWHAYRKRLLTAEILIKSEEPRGTANVERGLLAQGNCHSQKTDFTTLA
ncbi:TNFAIP3-interacting protein 3 [Saguinus oedipus]|uniref:TNFAIP3-interacting protein 3 n=1 Tax=Saguinus oedipus TaxID=9490 RepID=A0ABQ9W716_SAGOE|nr:TNFAIP3-interacting protein 3 [Saguinus oedipus]